MAQATHLTIATGERIRLEFPSSDETGDNDENEIHQEVRVSITYLLERNDTDLTALAAEKAEEVKAAHQAAWHRIGAFRCGCSAPKQSPPSEASMFSTRLDSSRQAAKPENDWQERRPPDALRPWGAALPRVPAVAVGPYPAGPAAGPSFSQDTSNGHPNGSGHTAIVPTPEPASKPQKILIRSRAQKAGLTVSALEEVLWKQYRRRSLEFLSKSQASAVLLALERYEQTGRIEIMDLDPPDTRREPGSAIGIMLVEENDEDTDADMDED